MNLGFTAQSVTVALAKTIVMAAHEQGAHIMPWKPSDASSKTKKAKSPKAKRQWSATANTVLSKSGDEGKAIRIANAAVRKRK